MIDVESASSTAKPGLALLGGWRRQSCCSEGHVLSSLSMEVRDCGRLENIFFQFPLLLQISSFSSYSLPSLLMVWLGFSACRYPEASVLLFPTDYFCFFAQ